jgi:repressor LexA
LNTKNIYGILLGVPRTNRQSAVLTEKQQAIYRFVCSFVRDQGFSPTLQEIANHFRQSISNIRQHLRLIEQKGMIELSPGKARRIHVLQAHEKNNQTFEPGIPLVGHIAAGNPILAEENVEAIIPVSHKAFGRAGDFALRVHGASMRDAGILDGDIAVFSKQPDVENGEIAAVRIGEEATLKRLIRQRGQIVLKAENPDFQDIKITKNSDHSISIEGKMVGLIRSYD